jgi:hypothetical protein
MIATLTLDDIRLRSIVTQHLTIILLGVGIFCFEYLEFANLFWEKLILIVVATGKSFYFVEHSFRKIEEASVKNLTYNKFLIIIMTNILLIVVSFAVDFSCIQKIDHRSFSGLSLDKSFTDAIFDLSYFSMLSFTSVAYGDIVPVSKAAKILTLLEVGVAYITTIIIISNFVQIKESIEEKIQD